MKRNYRKIQAANSWILRIPTWLHLESVSTSHVKLEEPIPYLIFTIDYARYSSFGKGLSSIASLSPDGCIDLSLDLKKDLPELPKDYAREVAEFGVDKREWSHYPHMNIVIMIVGSRGGFRQHLEKSLHWKTSFDRRCSTIRGPGEGIAKGWAPHTDCEPRDLSFLCHWSWTRILWYWRKPSRHDELHG